jgi:hypothetical protein
LLALLAATAVLYLWNLTACGYGNSFYAAAVQAGTQSPKAWLSVRWTPGTSSLSTNRPPRSGSASRSPGSSGSRVSPSSRHKR